MNLDNDVTLLNIANSVADTSGNFIPKGTVFTLNADGSGDFATILEAVNYLKGKYSNGAITFQLGAGNFAFSSTLIFDGDEFNIPHVIFNGSGTNVTTIKLMNVVNTSDSENGIINISNNCYIEFNNMTIEGVRSELYGEPVQCLYGSLLELQDVKLTLTPRDTSSSYSNNPFTGITSKYDSKIYVHGTITLENFNIAISSEYNSVVRFDSECTININYCYFGFQWLGFGLIQTSGSNITFNSVKTKAVDAVNTWSKRGYLSANANYFN